MTKSTMKAAAVAVVAVILLAQFEPTRGLVTGGNRFFR